MAGQLRPFHRPPPTNFKFSNFQETIMKAYFVTAFAALAASSALAIPATAGDIQGDAYGCKELWTMRNEIYKNNGYCFKTAKAISKFGNSGCSYDVLSAVPVSDQDRSVIRDIKKSEARQRC
jgi:YARHG domain